MVVVPIAISIGGGFWCSWHSRKRGRRGSASIHPRRNERRKKIRGNCRSGRASREGAGLDAIVVLQSRSGEMRRCLKACCGSLEEEYR